MHEEHINRRTIQIDLDDAFGFWTVQATSAETGETWWACSRTSEIAIGLVGSATCWGESPRSSWEPEPDGSWSAPWSITFNDRDRAIAEFRHNEKIATLVACGHGADLSTHVVALGEEGYGPMHVYRILTGDDWGYEREPVKKIVIEARKRDFIGKLDTTTED